MRTTNYVNDRSDFTTTFIYDVIDFDSRYSDNLFSDLIKESRLTTLQRKSLESSLRSGCGTSSSPSLQALKTKPKTPADKPIKRYRSTKPRTLKDIVESGAYEPEAYMPSRRQSEN